MLILSNLLIVESIWPVQKSLGTYDKSSPDSQQIQELSDVRFNSFMLVYNGFQKYANGSIFVVRIPII